MGRVGSIASLLVRKEPPCCTLVVAGRITFKFIAIMPILPMGRLGKHDSFRSTLFTKFHKPIVIALLLFSCEFFVGHIAIRASWVGSSYANKQHTMSHCTLISLPLLERYHVVGYKPLVSFIEEPRTPIWKFVVGKVSSALPSLEN